MRKGGSENMALTEHIKSKKSRVKQRINYLTGWNNSIDQQSQYQSSVSWSDVVVGSVRSWTSNHFPTNIWIILNTGCLVMRSVTWTSGPDGARLYPGQTTTDVFQPEDIAVDSIGDSLHPGHWLQSRKAFDQPWRIITALGSSIAMEPSLLLDSCWASRNIHLYQKSLVGETV